MIHSKGVSTFHLKYENQGLDFLQGYSFYAWET